MTPYFVIGGVTAAWAVILTFLGLTRENFPSNIGGVRGIIAVTGVLCLATVVTVISVTHVEHPREEAAAAERGEEGEQAQAESLASEEKPPSDSKSDSEQKSGSGSSNTVTATETDFKIDLSSGNSVDAGEYTFDVVNDSGTPHDLAIEGEGIDEKTKVINGGEKTDLKVDLKPGTYKVYCTVPGHEQAGMKLDLDVQ